MKRLLVLPCLALGACQALQPGNQANAIAVPTPAPCVVPGDIPTEPPQVGDQFNGDAKHDLQILAPSALALRKWGQELRALIVPACTTTGV